MILEASLQFQSLSTENQNENPTSYSWKPRKSIYPPEGVIAVTVAIKENNLLEPISYRPLESESPKPLELKAINI